MDAIKAITMNINTTRAEALSTALYNFLPSRTLLISSAENFYRSSPGDQCNCSQLFWKCFASRSFLAPIATWGATFAGVFTGILGLGFGPVGVAGGSFAAWFQGFVYGGFTPAGGLFAILTKMGMVGTLFQNAALFAVGAATAVTSAFWKVFGSG